MSENPHIIIGAGISGLSCAYTLDNALIIEKEKTLGGLCRTVNFQGLRFDLGGHRFFTDHPATEQLFLRLMSGQLMTVERKSKIYWQGQFIQYPLRKSVLRQLSPYLTARCLGTYLWRKIRPLQGDSFYERAANRFGDELYRLFLEQYTQKVWGLACRTIASELVDIRLQDISLLRAAKFALIRDLSIRSFADKFLYPQKGIVQLAEALAQKSRIRLKTAVTGFNVAGQRLRGVITDQHEQIECAHVVSTMPLTDLVRMLPAPPDIQVAAQHLRYRSIICVFLVLNKPYFSENHWIYFPGKEIFGRIHEPKNWSRHMADERRTGLCIEIFCDRHDPVWSLSDTAIAHQVIRDLPQVNRFDISEHAVLRVSDAYPVYKKDYRVYRQKVMDFLSQFENLHLLGRTGAYEYINMDTCLENGLQLGQSLTQLSASQRESACRT